MAEGGSKWRRGKCYAKPGKQNKNKKLCVFLSNENACLVEHVTSAAGFGGNKMVSDLKRHRYQHLGKYNLINNNSFGNQVLYENIFQTKKEIASEITRERH